MKKTGKQGSNGRGFCVSDNARFDFFQVFHLNNSLYHVENTRVGI